MYCFLILAACTPGVIAEWMVGCVYGQINTFGGVAGISSGSTWHPLQIKFLVFKMIWHVLTSLGLTGKAGCGIITIDLSPSWQQKGMISRSAATV